VTSAQLTAHNNRKLRELHPWLRPKITAIMSELVQHGWSPRIQCAWRSQADQLAAVASGASKVKWGFHCAESTAGTPEALAADIVLDNCPYDEPLRFKLQLLAMAQGHGLTTGALFGLAPGARMNVAAAVHAKAWDRVVPVGWDPWHVQPTPGTLTVDAARAGHRPA
jgi:hypothetical protein